MTVQQLSKKRKAKGITAKHVAKQLGVSQGYFCDMEKGRREMSELHAKLYGKAIGA